MTNLLTVTTGLSGLVAALFVTSLVFNILIWSEVNKEQEKPTPIPPPVPQSSSVVHTTVTEPKSTKPVSKPQSSSVVHTTVTESKSTKTTRPVTKPTTTVPSTTRTRISTKSTTRKSSAVTTPRTLRPSTTTSTRRPFTTTTAEPDIPGNDTVFCPHYGVSDNSYDYQEAAAYILSGLDETVDPCEDFYAFTCNKYIKEHDPQELGVGKFSPSKELQDDINAEIAEALRTVEVNSQQWSKTERITKAHNVGFLRKEKRRFGGIPFIGHPLKDGFDLFTAMGDLEQNHAMGTLMGGMVSVDYKKISQHALYISQPSLPMPREFYVLPQFTKKLQEREKLLRDVLFKFADTILDDPEPYAKEIKKAALDIVQLERRIAMASWPKTQLRNYAQQYNAYKLGDLKKTYPKINWESYLNALMSTAGKPDFSGSARLVIAQPSYFGWLNALVSGNTVDDKMLVNYMITQLIFEDADFLGGVFKKAAEEANYVPYAQRAGRGIARVGQQLFRTADSSGNANLPCISTIMHYMPYGPGYVYVKNKGNERNQVAADISKQTELVLKNFMQPKDQPHTLHSERAKFRQKKDKKTGERESEKPSKGEKNMMSGLKWMTSDSKRAAQMKANGMVKNYLWPEKLFGDFRDTRKLDDYHNPDYGKIIDLYNQNYTHNYYKMRNMMIKGFANRESLRLMKEEPDRANFLMSPAYVNAWYQPERNSITFPYAYLNPPFYNLKYPQAFNYGGQGGTGGHEIVHGFDDEGVQFGPDGSLSKCMWHECGWMTSKSKDGFRDMAQCVVTQYNTQCCPEKSGNILCANGATTQGENIADLGGHTPGTT
ncbi:peptidase family M13 [Ancylostoma ceylanicum]|uniref:Peptidase family M13 n=1 Tax=Ancylostoma ceylanicum TaxID=53326 RepID=A0A0D6LES4_9BILA|nr:peptidase family M13 [Ancylostoma ceylanicum]